MSRAVQVRYARASAVDATPSGADNTLALALDTSRGPVGVRGRVTDPALFRDALVTLVGIRESDLRYKGRDRAAYLAFLMKKGKKANAQIWAAQKAFLESQYGEATHETGILDPVLTVHPDEVSVEVFSRDESSYARLALKNALFSERSAAHGTACVDLSPAVLEPLARLPGYQGLVLDAALSPAPSPAQPPSPARPLERTWDLPLPWLRGFLQVQSAATLPTAFATLLPIDLYNILYALRMRRAKVPPRGLRFELIPGQRPRVVIEPWDIVLEGHGPVVTGGSARIVRMYGRQRLLLLQRVLPYAQSLTVRLVGPGLPSFFCLDLGLASLTMALSGWTESSWSSAAAFDALMPDPAHAGALADRLAAVLAERGPTPFLDLVAATNAAPADVRAATQLLSLRGRALFDVAGQVFRARDLFAQPIDDAELRFGSERERAAHRLLDQPGAVVLTKVHAQVGSVEISGTVTDVDSHRVLEPRFTMDAEGRAQDAGCTCPAVRRAGLKEGPCEHMVALRIAYGRKRAADEALRDTPEGRKLIRAETRTVLRRNADGSAAVWTVSLDDHVVYVEQSGRSQRLWFDTDEQARAAYFSRLESLESQGFVSAESS
ncbi:MAG TPA: SWIM zinc finger family protein [Myxococcota bacterium]|jgi:hypothetical protein